ncbi:hypothetical protein [Neobacillus kokaensis]|uniref:Uncharacterized protein n=1 Tax=Neobacillus kokaensis TaxID=2759023 RepID=A0ABQ3N7I1_9BACI|nr:hypothetical protein [Neobacillus kokaensis]GHH99468.1 hypothetical protein AM1BK_30110 [Neobacillus kokaensis]
MDNQNTIAKSLAVKDGRNVGIWQVSKPPKEEVDYPVHERIIDLKEKRSFPDLLIPITIY